MSEPHLPARLVQLRRDGTVTVSIQNEEAPYYNGPVDRGEAVYRCQVVDVDHIREELETERKALPWFRQRDRLRAISDLRRLDAGRPLLEHVAKTPVAAFSPSIWNVLTFIAGKWETDEPFRADLICEGGGAVFDAALPHSFGKAERDEYIRSLDRSDPRFRERVAAVLGRLESGLPD